MADCETAQRPTMRFVTVKSEAEQAEAVVFRTRGLLVQQRTQVINAVRGHLSEFGIIVAKGAQNSGLLAAQVEEPASGLPEPVRSMLGIMTEELRRLDERIRDARPRGHAPGKGQCHGSATDDHSWYRPDHGGGAGGLGSRRCEVQAGARLRGLAGPDTAAKVERRRSVSGGSRNKASGPCAAC